MAQSFPGTSPPHRFPPQGSDLLARKSCVHGTAAKILQSPKFCHKLLNVQPSTHAKAQTLPGNQLFHVYRTPQTSYSESLSGHSTKSLSPPHHHPRTAHSGAGSTRGSPAFPSPAAQTPLHSHLQPCSVPLSLPTPLPGAIPIAKGMGQQHQAASEIRALAFHPSSTNTLLGDAGCGPALPQFPQLPFERYW